ncbi:MAG: DUF2905 domain-containing protein [Deltaproteobacteria bacterium]|nr:DUF2905 domain-containing protein [Deltaproteobacteria bacterium]
MLGLNGLGKILIFFGLVLAVLGVLLLLLPKIPWLGRLPGDVIFRKGNLTIYFPWVTCLLVSIFLTLLLALFRK